jgi:hypothetical protein
MGAPFRSELHAAMARVEALERENARLRATLATLPGPAARRPRTPRRAPPGRRAWPPPVRRASGGALEWLALVTLGVAFFAHLAATSICYTPPDTASYIVFAAARGN